MTPPFMSRDGRPMLWIMPPDGVIRPAADLPEWNRAMFHAPDAHGDIHDRHLARDRVGAFFISTIFTGIDTELRGPPMVFETMVFKDDNARQPRRQIRNPTRAEALETHAAMVKEYGAYPSSSS